MSLLDETLDNRVRLTDLRKSKADAFETWRNVDDQFDALTFVDPKSVDPAVEAEFVEGLPIGLVRLYADIAVRHATYQQVEDGVWVAMVTDLDGAWGDGETPSEAKDELHEAIVGWVAVKRRVGATIPAMEGIDLNEKR